MIFKVATKLAKTRKNKASKMGNALVKRESHTAIRCAASNDCIAK